MVTRYDGTGAGSAQRDGDGGSAGVAHSSVWEIEFDVLNVAGVVDLVGVVFAAGAAAFEVGVIAAGVAASFVVDGVVVVVVGVELVVVVAVSLFLLADATSASQSRFISFGVGEVGVVG